MASELGYDAGFGRGTLPSEVASFIALRLPNAQRSRAREDRARHRHNRPGRFVLAELLLREGYRVVGMTRRTSTDVHERIAHLVDDVESSRAICWIRCRWRRSVDEVAPDEVYNLAAQSFVPGVVAAAGADGRIHRARRDARARSDPRRPSLARFYQASSSEMFGKVVEVRRTEGPGDPAGFSNFFFPAARFSVFTAWAKVFYRGPKNLGETFSPPPTPGQKTLIRAGRFL